MPGELTTPERVSAAVALAVGAGAAFAPRRLLALYGIPPGELTGAGEFGWRLFAARNLVIGGAALAGQRWASDVILAVQAPDQVVFAHAFATRSIPRPAAVAAMATSGLIIGLGVRARTGR